MSSGQCNFALGDQLAQWFIYSPNAVEAAGSLPAQFKRLHSCTCLFVLGLDFSMYNMYVFKKVYKYVYNIRYLESITHAL
jgi:hypothetical protein